MSRLLYEDLKKHLKKIQRHIMFWLLFIGSEITLTQIAISSTPLIHYLLFYVINIGIFYSHAAFLLRYMTTSPVINIIRVIILLIFELSLYFILAIFFSSALNKYLYHRSFGIEVDFKYFIITGYRAMCFILYSTGYYYLTNYNRKTERSLLQDIENEKLKNDILRTEQDFLRAQINPHLLFNTLSFIKYAARKKPEEADEAVMRLSAIMGFALENNSETILVTKELEQVENIIALNQLRYNHTLNINFIKDLQNRNATIVPIVLLTLVENVFKHGELLQAEHPAEFWIESTDQYLLVKTSNLPSFSSGVTSTNKGLANIKSRMNQFYGDQFYLEHYIDGLLFKVELKINY